MSIKDNIKSVAHNVEKVKEKNKISTPIHIMAVSKTHPAVFIREAYDAGMFIFGENKVQEAQNKIPGLADLEIEWHMVGHLQRNKAKLAAELFSWVDSLDKLSTAEALEKALYPLNKTMNILIEVNTTGEKAKYGCDPGEVKRLVDGMLALNHLKLRGLLTLGPLEYDEHSIRKSFSTLKQIYDRLKQDYKELSLDTLSMGMSGDYEIAIEEGSNMIRLGTILFGERQYK